MPGSPADSKKPEPKAASDDIHAQRGRILAYLKANGRTSCPSLAAACDVPSVTSRVCELIASDWPITRTRGYVRNRHGLTRRTTFYELTGAHAQRDLFGAP